MIRCELYINEYVECAAVVANHYLYKIWIFSLTTAAAAAECGVGDSEQIGKDLTDIYKNQHECGDTNQ